MATAQHRPPQYSTLERAVLLNADPIAFMLSVVGAVVAFYFVWQHELPLAILVGFLYIGNGALFALIRKPSDREAYAHSILGKLFLRYGAPLPFAFYVSAQILIPIGAYVRDWEIVAIGAIVLWMGGFLPHRRAATIHRTDLPHLPHLVRSGDRASIHHAQSVRHRRSSSSA